MALPRDMFGDCEYSALQRLAELLYLTDIEHDSMSQPEPAWLERQANAVKDQLYNDLRLRGWRLIKSFFVDINSQLCEAHHGLDRKLVQWCLSLLQMEISIRVDFLRIYLRGPSKNNNGDVANRDGVGLDVKNLSDLLECLTGIATLYFEPPCFNRYFGDGTGRQHRFATVKSKCPACVLSVVGGRRDLLSVLRANMLARTKKKTPRLLPLIEAWIDNLGTVTAKRRRDSSRAAEIIAGMRRHSDGIRAQLISVRKRLNEHREAREHGGEKRDDSGMRLRSSRRGGTTPSLTRTSDGVPLPSQRFFSRADGTYRWRRGVGGEGEEVLPKATAGMQNGSKDDALALGPWYDSDSASGFSNAGPNMSTIWESEEDKPIIRSDRSVDSPCSPLPLSRLARSRSAESETEIGYADSLRLWWRRRRDGSDDRSVYSYDPEEERSARRRREQSPALSVYSSYFEVPPIVATRRWLRREKASLSARADSDAVRSSLDTVWEDVVPY